MSKRRVVVTGMGVVTPIGLTLDEFWKNLIAGVSGAAPITYFDTSLYDTHFACELKGFKAADHLDRKAVQRMDPFTHYAMATAGMAIRDAGLNFDQLDRNRIGVIYGSGIGGMMTYDAQFRNYFQGGPRRISPFFIPMLIPDIAAGYISIKYQLRGPNYAVVSACATSSHAIGDAFRTIQYGDADIIVCGGAEAPITPMGLGGFNASNALSVRNDAPEKASRPFDKDRDGFVMGEGSGTLILEELEHAKARGARIHAEVAGLGITADAHHLTAPAPSGDGAARSMSMAIRDAGLQPTAVDYINVHGTSTPLGDIAETQAIKTVFGEHAHALNISSTKSMTGHLLGAAGAVEGITTIMSIINNTVHPTINLDNPDPECDLNYTPNHAVKRTVDVALSNTFGFGGHNATLLFRRFTE